jgi:hypothetical protein
MGKHALLSASGAKRWLSCPPSARLEQKFENTTSVYAEEGTLAHELGELNLRKNLEDITLRSYNAKLKKIKENELFTEDMIDYVGIYVDTCMEKIAEAKSISSDAVINLEQRLDFSEWVPDGFGTGDMVIIADGIIEIVDLKYGKGVPVSAVGNIQMRLYALGAINEFQFLYDIEKVKMTIVQPRLDSISSDEMDIADLLKWAEEVLKPTAELAYKGEGEFCAGEHCGFCKARYTCKARADKNMELAKYDFQDSELLSNDDIAEILSKVDDLAKWAKDIQDYALEQALNGTKYNGFKLVEGRSNRKWTDEDKIGEILIGQGFQENIIYTKKLTGISNMEAAIGKKEVVRLLGDYIIKPPGKPTLAPESDKRPEFNSAEVDFK